MISIMHRCMVWYCLITKLTLECPAKAESCPNSILPNGEMHHIIHHQVVILHSKNNEIKNKNLILFDLETLGFLDPHLSRPPSARQHFIGPSVFRFAGPGPGAGFYGPVLLARTCCTTRRSEGATTSSCSPTARVRGSSPPFKWGAPGREGGDF